MKVHYKKGKLVETDILPRHANTYYYKINNNLYEFYSYHTLVGYIVLIANRKHPCPYFIEWAHTEHYSVTTSKQCTILANELAKKYNGLHKIVTREQGMKELDELIANKEQDRYYLLLHMNMKGIK